MRDMRRNLLVGDSIALLVHQRVKPIDNLLLPLLTVFQRLVDSLQLSRGCLTLLGGCNFVFDLRLSLPRLTVIESMPFSLRRLSCCSSTFAARLSAG